MTEPPLTSIGVTALPLLSIAGLVAVAFTAGLVDAIAGGGGLLTLPALLHAGLSPQIALGTNKGQSAFGTASSVVAFWRKGALDPKRAVYTFPLGFLGSLCGAALVIYAVPREWLRPIVIVLLALAALTLLIPRKDGADRPRPSPRAAAMIAASLAFGIGMYDGFFGPGCGTFLVIGFSFFLAESLLSATADAKVVNFGSNLSALLLFAWHGDILWHVSLPMAAGQLAGSWTGAHLAVKGGDKLIRPVVLVIVALLIAKLAFDATQ